MGRETPFIFDRAAFSPCHDRLDSKGNQHVQISSGGSPGGRSRHHPLHRRPPAAAISTPSVQNISAEATSAGISQGVIASALGGVQQDPAVLNFDRRQRYTFNKSFEQYVSTRVGSGRINGGRAAMQRHAALLSSIEAKFGVPRQILVAIWGLETDFGQGRHGPAAGVSRARDHGA